MNNEKSLKNYLTLDHGIKFILLILIIIVTNFIYMKFAIKKAADPIKFAQIDLVKISSDYMQKSILLVANVSENTNLTPDQKMAKSKNVMQIVGTSIDSLVNDYSEVHKVVVIQKQMVVSSDGFSIPDITDEIEKQIDSRINPDELHNAVTK